MVPFIGMVTSDQSAPGGALQCRLSAVAPTAEKFRTAALVIPVLKFLGSYAAPHMPETLTIGEVESSGCDAI